VASSADRRSRWRKKVPIEHATEKWRALIVGLKGCICAVPLAQVIEIMRPLPIESLSSVPTFVSGLAIIRGIPTPVVDLAAVLGTPNEAAERFVTMRVGDRQVALSVDAVLGVRDLDAIMTRQKLPPLLQRASKDFVETLGTLDEQLLMVLRTGWELPDEVWQALTAQEAVS
jgi:purine-binding chemotaxis protein CheW